MYMYMYIYLGGGGFREPMDFTAFEKLGSIGSPWGNHVPFKRLKGTIPNSWMVFVRGNAI